ncbi:FGGY family carbohydrate kinase [Blastococcus goldschmidtiae]|uniref:FGGY family carbohydrate kinase n=1 Tax=Blastococcus goldschmidtiae TaxID=3075546 RepID=A0ABU2KBW6_9ACTN|nr:FGGY family carbohydrate kinase [Blastococcus sp. DSM 46792]MDT0277673.1 FGGY family carbohydrate kinase [Blastococcus sp. DSM 46792]
MTGGVFLGADLGTSGLKVVALDDAGAVVAQAEREYAYDRPAPGRAEIDVRVWRTAFDAAVGELGAALDGRPVRALGLSGQMHGAVLVDAAGRPVRPALLWPDGRAAGELVRWRRLPDADRAALANPLVAGMTGPMLAWLAAHEPDAVARAAAVLLPKDALRAALVPGGPPVTDRSDASATLLWDVVADGWSPAATAAAGVPAGLLPGVRPAGEVVGTTSVGGAEVPVVVGGADTPLALLAAGTTRGLQVNLGTGAQVLRPGWAPRPVTDPATHGYADVSGSWYAMAALRNGGSAWAWVRAVLGLGWAELVDVASGAGPGAGGVLFRPFLTGERGGVAGPDDRGSWTGLHGGTTRADLARSAVEGVAFAIAAAAESLGGAGGGDPVVLTGGGVRSPLVQQVLADVLGRPVRHLRLRSASAIGAAVLAARGVGVDLVPERRHGPVVEPRADPRLTDAARRWTGSP